VYGTGNATSLPERFYIVEGVLTQEFSKVNQYRLPAYHRIDLSATYTPKQKPGKKIQSNWVFSIYNVYSRKNPYFIYYDQSGSPYDGTLKVEALQVTGRFAAIELLLPRSVQGSCLDWGRRSR
jgi:hypothetical protein